MKAGDKLWTNWNKAPLKLWQKQLNSVVFCVLSACGVSSGHLNYKKHSVVGALYKFHVRRVLKRLQVPLPHETSLRASENPYMSKEFFKIFEDYGVAHNPMKYRDKIFCWIYQRGVVWLNDYIGLDSMTCWLIEKSQGFIDVGLLRISESVRAYVYLILSSQASARSSIIGNTVSASPCRLYYLGHILMN